MAISKCEIDEKSENEHLMLIGQSRTLKSIVQRNAIPMSNCQIIIWYKNVSIQNVGFILRTISSPLCRICTFVFSSNPPPIKTTPYLWFLLMESLIDVWIILSVRYRIKMSNLFLLIKIGKTLNTDVWNTSY